MKKRSFFLLIFLGIILNSQAQGFFGRYLNEEQFQDGIYIKYELILNKDSTYKFHFYQDQLCYIDDVFLYGNWLIKDQEILLTPKENNNIKMEDFINLKDVKLKALDSNSFKIYNSKTIWLNSIVLKKIN